MYYFTSRLEIDFERIVTAVITNENVNVRQRLMLDLIRGQIVLRYRQITHDRLLYVRCDLRGIEESHCVIEWSPFGSVIRIKKYQ